MSRYVVVFEGLDAEDLRKLARVQRRLEQYGVRIIRVIMVVEVGDARLLGGYRGAGLPAKVLRGVVIL